MLQFGKKINYRPLLISLLIALLPGVIFANILQSIPLGVVIGGLFFLYIFFIYYFPNLPTLFSYWKVTSQQINYYNLNNRNYRIIALLAPNVTPMTTINREDIQKVIVIGNLNKQQSMPPAIPYTPGVAIYSPILSMIHHPETVRIILKNGTHIDLSIARDYTYSREITLKKLAKFFQWLDDIPVQTDLPKNHQKSASLSI